LFSKKSVLPATFFLYRLSISVKKLDLKHPKFKKNFTFVPSFKNDQAMKRSLTFKSLLITASLLSVFAFAFVNFRTNKTLAQPFSKIEMAQNQVEGEDGSEAREIPVPDVSVLGRVWEIAQRFLNKAN